MECVSFVIYNLNVYIIHIYSLIWLYCICSVFDFKPTLYLLFSTLINNEIHSSSATISRKRAFSSQWVNGTERPQCMSACS